MNSAVIVDLDATTIPIIYGAVLLLIIVVLPKGPVPGDRDQFARLRRPSGRSPRPLTGSVDQPSDSPEALNGKVPTR